MDSQCCPLTVSPEHAPGIRKQGSSLSRPAVEVGDTILSEPPLVVIELAPDHDLRCYEADKGGRPLKQRHARCRALVGITLLTASIMILTHEVGR